MLRPNLSIRIPVGVSIPKPTIATAIVASVPREPGFSISAIAIPVPARMIRLAAITGVIIGISACITGPCMVGPRRLSRGPRMGTRKR